MFKLNRHRSDRHRDKCDFKFSNFQAIQVPKGWDKLFVSLVSVETGKTMLKSGKASVRHGTCRWTETFSESIFISQDNGDSKELDGNHLKFVVAMGSSRSGVLGEVIINLGDHASSKTANSVTLQLNKCNYNTSLQFKIQCLTPKAKHRDAQGKETNINVEDGSSDHDDMETTSNASDGAFPRNSGSPSSNHLEHSLSRRSFESTGASSGKDMFSSSNNHTGAVNNRIERQDSIDSQNSGRSNHSFHSRAPDSLGPNGHRKEPNSSVMSSPSRTGSSKDLLEAAEVTIEELRAEARMWERNSKKLMVDVDALKKELSDQSRNQETLTMELSASHQECNGLKQEIKHLKSLLEESTQKQNAEEDLKLQAKDMEGAQHEMDEEIRLLKESNASLTEQLQKTQESNVELLTILQELEGIIETQKSEIHNLSSGNDVDNGGSTPESIDSIKLQLQQLQETQEELEGAIQELEEIVLQKDTEIEMERERRIDSESKWMAKVAAKEVEITKLEAKLAEAIKEQQDRKLEVESRSETDLAREIEFLRSKVKELENDCNELTEENLQLVLKLKEPGGDKGALIEDAASSAQSEVQSLDLENKCSDLEIELQSFKEKTMHLEDELQKFHARVGEQQTEVQALQQQLKHYQAKENDSDKLRHNPELVNSNGYTNGTNSQSLDKAEAINSDLIKELQKKISEAGGLTSIHLKEEEIEALRKLLPAYENQISSLHEENRLLQESLEGDKSLSSQSLEEQKKKIVTLERLSSELEKGKQDVEQQLSVLEKENLQLTERISAMEAQLRYLTNEKEACQLELQDSKSQVMNLRKEIKRLETDIEAQKADTNQKMQDLQKQWLEAQEECEYLKQANPKLQATAENLIEECTTLQKYNGELKRQNVELVTRHSAMESQLRDSIARFSECSLKVEALEAELSVMEEEFSLKEKSLRSELDSLVIADREFKEKLMQENVLLNNMYSQKVVEVEKVQRELEHLIDQISVAQNEPSDTMRELSALRTERAKLEVSLQQLQRQFVRLEGRLSTSESKVLELTRDLKASRHKQEALMAENDKILKLLEGYKSNDAKHKSIINEHEKNLKASGYERLQLAEEVSTLKEQLQRASSLQAQVVALKVSLNTAKFESEKANTSLDLLRGEHEKLKIEKESLVQKISGMEKALSELEECQRSRATLEEKVLRLEGDLAAREVLCLQDAELRFELNKVKRANGELQRKIKHLEQDQEEHLKKVKALQEQLKKNNQMIQDGVNSTNDFSDLDDELTDTASSSREENRFSGTSGATNADHSLKIQTLETELAEALEACEMYKSQLRGFLSEEQKNSGHSKNGVDVLALKEELRELQERYFKMSLKYAEVEAQREELVLKLKSLNTNKRRWF